MVTELLIFGIDESLIKLVLICLKNSNNHSVLLRSIGTKSFIKI